jgi:hypothetical protein
MCFSAEASFGAAVVLSAIGVASINKAQQSNERAFAAIPLIFAAQQVFEGFIWLADGSPAFQFMQPFSTYAFLFFAQILWPVWIPFSILKLNGDKKFKKIQRVLLGVGIVSSAYLAFCLINFPVEGKVAGYHIAYVQLYPESLNVLSGIIYMIATVIPPIVSGTKNVWILGVAIFISYLITAIFYTGYIVSVWCFFAAIISGFVLLIFYRKKSM